MWMESGLAWTCGFGLGSYNCWPPSYYSSYDSLITFMLFSLFIIYGVFGAFDFSTWKAAVISFIRVSMFSISSVISFCLSYSGFWQQQQCLQGYAQSWHMGSHSGLHKSQSLKQQQHGWQRQGQHISIHRSQLSKNSNGAFSPSFIFISSWNSNFLLTLFSSSSSWCWCILFLVLAQQHEQKASAQQPRRMQASHPQHCLYQNVHEQQ